jgi:hypothetical protein
MLRPAKKELEKMDNRKRRKSVHPSKLKKDIPTVGTNRPDQNKTTGIPPENWQN